MVNGSSDSWMGSYIIKRTFSECSLHIISLTLPELHPSISLKQSADAHTTHTLGSSDAHTTHALASSDAHTTHALGSSDAHTTDALGSSATLSASSQASQPAGASTMSMVVAKVKAAISTLTDNLAGMLLKSPARVLTPAVSVHERLAQNENLAQLQPLEACWSNLRPEGATCVNPDAVMAEGPTVTQRSAVNESNLEAVSKVIAGKSD